jgi:hypothetical protein
LPSSPRQFNIIFTKCMNLFSHSIRRKAFEDGEMRLVAGCWRSCRAAALVSLRGLPA